MYQQFTTESFQDSVIPFPSVTKKATKRRPWLPLPSDNDVALLLERASDLLRIGFTQSKFAQTANGTDTTPLDINAIRFCAIGALRRANCDLHSSKFLARLHRRIRYDFAIRALFDDVNTRIPTNPLFMNDPSVREATIMYWNDTTDKATVLAGFNRAIVKWRM